MRGTASKTVPREGGQEDGYAMTDRGKMEAPIVPVTATQGAETATTSSDWSWVEAGVWTERMLSALVNGVVVPKARASSATAADGSV